MTGFVVLGTDTDAGKTAFSAQWMAAFTEQFAYWKPVETGESDTTTIRRLVPAAKVYPPHAQFREPLAPVLAAAQRGADDASNPGRPRGGPDLATSPARGIIRRAALAIHGGVASGRVHCGVGPAGGCRDTFDRGRCRADTSNRRRPERIRVAARRCRVDRLTGRVRDSPDRTARSDRSVLGPSAGGLDRRTCSRGRRKQPRCIRSDPTTARSRAARPAFRLDPARSGVGVAPVHFPRDN